MTEIKVKVSRTTVRATTDGYLTSGMVGVQAVFEYDSKVWDGLTKTAVFAAGKVTRDVLNADREVEVPAEVLAKPNEMLSVGVCGTDDAGDLVIPTVMTSVGFILPGADPSGDESTNPELPVWAQHEIRIKKLEEGGAGGDSIIVDDDGYLTTASGGFEIDDDGYIVL